MVSEAVSYPFHRLKAETVHAGNWEYSKTGDEMAAMEQLGAAIESWDYMVNLVFKRSIRVVMSEVLDDCGFKNGASLILVVLVSTAGQRIRRKIQHIRFECDESKGISEFELSFFIEGKTIQGDLRIDTEMCVEKALSRDENDPFTPKTPGSRIWSDSVTTSLEGSLSRFPMSSVSFSQAFGDVKNAAWMLHWTADSLENNASSVLRLYLNEDSTLYSEITACNSALCDIVQTDVLRQILIRVLSDPEINISPESWPEYSLGGIAAQWICNIFGEVEPEFLRSRARSEPGWVDARIQSYMRSIDVD